MRPALSSEDLNSGPKAHVRQLTISLTYLAPGDTTPFSGFLGTLAYELINENKNKSFKIR